MKFGKVSQTALKVGLVMITLNEKAGWKTRLPRGLAELTERLILAADVFGYGSRMISLNKKQWVVRLSEYCETKIPGVFEGIGERKIFVNEQVLAAIETGATQVWVLGAGFDTLCLRLAPQFPHVQFFEVDHPATSAAKAKGIAQVGQPENLFLVPVDIKETPLSKIMCKYKHRDSSIRPAVVAEGLFLYLERQDVLGVFREVAACTAPGTRVIFSHGIELEKHRFTNAILHLIGEPWLSSCASEDLSEYIGSGWTVTGTRNAHPKHALEGFAVAKRLCY